YERDGLEGTLDQAARINRSSQISDLTVVRTKRWYNNDPNNFAPRVGLVWDPWSNGKSAIRASYGVYYDAPIGATFAFVDANTPGFTQTATYFPNQSGSDLRLSDGIPSVPRTDTPVARPAPVRQSTVALFDPNLRTGYLHAYSLSLQREIARNTVAEAAYLG